MKQLLCLLLSGLLLSGCGSNTITEVTAPPASAPDAAPPAAASRFHTVTEIALSDAGISVNGGGETKTVYTSQDIIYYEDRDRYDSGNPYGEGTAADKHTAAEADAHTVVNITAPGAYRVTGQLSAGQIRIDLGEEAPDDPSAVAELILSDCEITCTVAPAILFLNTYECDGSWSTETASPTVDTSAAGANLILEGENIVNGSYVARIYKDKDGEKKLWKQDGAIYSYMSMNVSGPGNLDLTAANEGLDTELHLTINGGNIRIFAQNDGINTNEDGVSVTTINDGCLTVFAGLGQEGDGIDSNGYLVINGGTVTAWAHPGSDAGLDSDLGSFIHGGCVTAFGAAMDWAEHNSGQAAMNLQFASTQDANTEIAVTAEDGSVLCIFQPEEEYARPFTGLILSRPAFAQGETYHVSVNGVQMAYTGTDLPGGHGRPGQPPNGFAPGEPPEGFDPPDGMAPEPPEGMQPPEKPQGHRPERPAGDPFPSGQAGEPSTGFYMNDTVNFFSGLSAAS